MLQSALANQPLFYVFLIGLSVVITLIAGLYPAFILSGYSPVTALKSKITSHAGKGVLLRRGLVVFQFTISQILIMGTIVVVQQMYFIQNKDLGFEKDAVVVIESPKGAFKKPETLKNELMAISGIESISFFTKNPHFKKY